MEKYIVSMQCEAHHPIYIGIPIINSISNTEVQFQISVGMPTPISTWYDQIYQRWIPPPTHMQHIFSIRCYGQLTDLGMWSSISKQQVVRSTSWSIDLCDIGHRSQYPHEHIALSEDMKR